MPERVYFCFCGDNCKFETMTKEQIITAIYEAALYGQIQNIDDGFITKVKEQNKGETLTFWLGTTAEFNAIEEEDPKCFYIKTDDTAFEDMAKEIEAIKEATEKRLDALSEEIRKSRVYGDMDSFTASQLPLYGYITSNCTVLKFLLPLSKTVIVDTVTVNILDIYVGGVQGSFGDKIQAASDINYFTEAAIVENGILFAVHNTTGAFSNAVNGTPIAVNAADIDILFTQSEN